MPCSLNIDAHHDTADHTFFYYPRIIRLVFHPQQNNLHSYSILRASFCILYKQYTPALTTTVFVSPVPKLCLPTTNTLPRRLPDSGGKSIRCYQSIQLAAHRRSGLRLLCTGPRLECDTLPRLLLPLRSTQPRCCLRHCCKA